MQGSSMKRNPLILLIIKSRTSQLIKTSLRMKTHVQSTKRKTTIHLMPISSRRSQLMLLKRMKTTHNLMLISLKRKELILPKGVNTNNLLILISSLLKRLIQPKGKQMITNLMPNLMLGFLMNMKQPMQFRERIKTLPIIITQLRMIKLILYKERMKMLHLMLISFLKLLIHVILMQLREIHREILIMTTFKMIRLKECKGKMIQLILMLTFLKIVWRIHYISEVLNSNGILIMFYIRVVL